MRTLAAKVPEDVWPEVKARVQAVCQAPGHAITRDRAKGVVEEFGRGLPSVAVCVEGDFEACIAHLRMPAVDDRREPVQLRTLQPRRAPVSRRRRERKDLARAVARDVETPRRPPPAHALRKNRLNLKIHVRENNPPALPTAIRKDKAGRLFQRRSQPHIRAKILAEAAMRAYADVWAGPAGTAWRTARGR